MLILFFACFDSSKNLTQDTGSTDSGIIDTGSSITDSGAVDSGDNTDTSDSGAVPNDSGTTDSGGGTGSIKSNVCSQDSDCGGNGHCVPVVDDSLDVLVCQYPTDIWLHECTEYSWGCCSDTDCDSGVCAAMEINYCGGAAPAEENVCVYEDCLRDTECSIGSVCLDAGVLGSLTGRCVPAFCTQHSDCSGTDARCSLVYDGVTCPSVLLTCTNAQSECHWYGDCEGGRCVGTQTGVSCQEDMPPP